MPDANSMRFIGVDLAWQTDKHHSGIAVAHECFGDIETGYIVNPKRPELRQRRAAPDSKRRRT
jgi:predicted RNase H-like nuclease